MPCGSFREIEAEAQKVFVDNQIPGNFRDSCGPIGRSGNFLLILYKINNIKIKCVQRECFFRAGLMDFSSLYVEGRRK